MTISNWIKMAESPSKWEGNTVGKGQIAHYKQFFLFPQCFLKGGPSDTGMKILQKY